MGSLMRKLEGVLACWDHKNPPHSNGVLHQEDRGYQWVCVA